jgi:hypothetical protein
LPKVAEAESESQDSNMSRWIQACALTSWLLLHLCPKPIHGFQAPSSWHRLPAWHSGHHSLNEKCNGGAGQAAATRLTFLSPQGESGHGYQSALLGMLRVSLSGSLCHTVRGRKAGQAENQVA